MEYLQSSDGSFPIVRIMSEIAGISVMLTAGELLKVTRWPRLAPGRHLRCTSCQSGHSWGRGCAEYAVKLHLD